MTAKMHPFWWFLPPEITCPSGEQITNGGFETGDLTGWICGGDTPSCSVHTEEPHSGSYAARIHNAYPYSHLRQELSTPVPVSCVKTFEFYARTLEPGNLITALVRYTDDTTTTIEYTPAGWTWLQCDIKSKLEPEKTIKRISFYYTNNAYVMDLDDVTLIGTG